MAKILTNDIFSPQNYLCLLTDKTYIIPNEGSDVDFVRKFTKKRKLKDYSLGDIPAVVASKAAGVVLVDCVDLDQGCFFARWFEVTEEFASKIPKEEKVCKN